MSDAINIEFTELSYSVKSNFFNRGRRKEILKNVNGKFEASKVSAIVGPSGSGKSTLLNALSGFQHKNVDGNIKFNGLQINNYRSHIVYIMQDNHLQPLLTVSESMNFAVKLKTGNSLNSFNKWKKICEILETFGLAEKENELVGNLSGGQQKRLAIALEIVDDPHVIFLDECTTGLDSNSSTQCLRILKDLALAGRTIVCTIHQPSGLLLRMFDQLYALADGECVYQGSTTKLVSFLSELNLPCPPSYNPADFLLEIVSGVYGQKNRELVEKIENGRNENYRQNADHLANEAIISTTSSITHSFSSRFHDLLMRNFLISYRDKSFFYIRMFMHISVGVLLGLLYYDVGNNASHILNNFRLIFVALSFLVYTSYYSTMMVFPLNFAWIKRETFNRWYSPMQYYLALIISDLPILIIAQVAFIIPVYYMTSQPLELFRIAAFVLIMMLTSFVSQSFGLVCGSLAGVKGTLILAPVLMIFHGAFAGFYILKKDSHPFWHNFYELSYLKYSAYASEMSVMGFNRSKMHCDELYCHFRSPTKFLQSIEFEDDFGKCCWMLLANFIIYNVMAYGLMRYRLKNK